MESLWERAQNHILITAHGGYNSGLFNFNSMQGFEAAVHAGADIIELDVSRSAEGTLFVFHPGTETHFPQHFHIVTGTLFNALRLD